MLYVFAGCILDTRCYTLYQTGRRIRLRPKVFQVLTYLLVHRDRVVTKQELCEQVWCARFVSDAAIENCIKAVRHATGDDGHAQRIIETQYGRGYRFVAGVGIYPETSPALPDVANVSPRYDLSHAQELRRSIAQIQAAPYLQEMHRSTFWPVLPPETAYHAMLENPRQQYHQQIARMLTEQFPEAAEYQPEILAHHYTAAGLNEPAIAHWQRAGQHAVHRAAFGEALAYFTKGLELLRALPMTPARARQELMLQCGLAVPLAAQGSGTPEVEHTYSRALELCQQVGDTRESYPVLFGLHQLYKKRGALRAAHALGEQLLNLAYSQNDSVLLVYGHCAVGEALLWLGEFSAARVNLEQGIVHYDPEQHRTQAFRYGSDPGLSCMGALTWVLWYLGYPDQALQRSDESLSLASEFSHPYSLAKVLTYAVALHALRQEWQTVQEYTKALQALATQHGLAQLAASATRYDGMALVRQGRVAEGIAQIHQGIAALQTLRAQEARASQLAWLAEMYGQAGRAEEGLRLL